MKRLARAFGLLGGIGAIIYVLRDRLISVTAPREPEPPRFQPIPPQHETPGGPDSTAPRTVTSETQDDLTVILGIGPTYAARLADAGVTGFADLASRTAGELADEIDIAETKVAEWIREAASL